MCLFVLEDSPDRNKGDILDFMFLIPAPITLEKLYGILSSVSHELLCSLHSSRSLCKFLVIKMLHESSI